MASRKPPEPKTGRDGPVTKCVYVTDPETQDPVCYDVGSYPDEKHMPLIGDHCFEPVTGPGF